MLLTIEPRTRLKIYAVTFWRNEKWGNYVEIVEEPLCLGGATCLWNSIFCNPTWIFSPRNMGAIRIYLQWSRDTAANGIHICWLITAGHLYSRHQQKNTRHKRRGNDLQMSYLFIFRLVIVRRHNFHVESIILQFWKYINPYGTNVENRVSS